jgi:hypothetical protein
MFKHQRQHPYDPQGPAVPDEIRGRPHAMQVSWLAIHRAKDSRGQGAHSRGTAQAMGQGIEGWLKAQVMLFKDRYCQVFVRVRNWRNLSLTPICHVPG